jgi:DNA primase
LIERARQQHPGATAEAKLKAMNFLLPHIRRIPQKLLRDQFAADAAQKLGIESSVLREELRQAAIRRRDHVDVRPSTLSEVERVLIRALAITDPEFEDSRRVAVDALSDHQEWFEQLGCLPALMALSWRAAEEPMDLITDPDQRALVAQVLFAEGDPPSANTVRGAIESLEQTRLQAQQRELRAMIAEAERRSDFAELAILTQKKLELDRALRKLDN